jgi:ABC-type glycerol-3-phosphate transport system permease component
MTEKRMCALFLIALCLVAEVIVSPIEYGFYMLGLHDSLDWLCAVCIAALSIALPIFLYAMWRADYPKEGR